LLLLLLLLIRGALGLLLRLGRRLSSGVLRVSVGRCRIILGVFVALRWLLLSRGRLIGSGGHGLAWSRLWSEQNALDNTGTVWPTNDDVVETGARKNGGEHFSLRRRPSGYGHAFRSIFSAFKLNSSLVPDGCQQSGQRRVDRFHA
jgi:hypothetical protein